MERSAEHMRRRECNRSLPSEPAATPGDTARLRAVCTSRSRSYGAAGVRYLTIARLYVRDDGDRLATLCSSALDTRLFHRGSLRASAIASNTVSGADSTVTVATTRTA